MATHKEGNPTYMTLQEALSLIDSGQRFSVAFWKADKRRGVAGQMKVIPVATKSRNVQSSGYTTATKEQASKHPNHFENATRNIIDLQERRTVKIHIRLIHKINGQKVL